ncbi:hypothetical protein BCR33DRAFT_716864 [Rhizoclosmatium globosum]|uniref:N-acetyltransferase domain-containing protein n=1 Tax=Rhizoclosmatium globosum TaxID=329046 RepID=A0A1Y2CB73_9FUNG|nr:hypothetical protein BCR33DRAFT_716864 [Rhizoclosmatium globosum]|eukprot:ORY44290.1 hypothetical protein BCR33DRAFT_716864 [Rhizoclosmatium globosum]
MSPSPPKYAVRKTSLASAEAQALIGQLNQALYDANPNPAAHSWTISTQDVAPGLGAFVIAYKTDTNEPVGCGAIRKIVLDESSGLTEHTTTVAELKRMFVKKEFRGERIGRLIVAALEVIAKEECGVDRLVLETGPYLGDAIRLYEKCGFENIPLFGEYAEKGPEFSACFGKSI